MSRSRGAPWFVDSRCSLEGSTEAFFIRQWLPKEHRHRHQRRSMHSITSGSRFMGHSNSSEVAVARTFTVTGSPELRKVGRFAETRQVKWGRSAFRLLCKISPTLSAHLAYKLLATPPRCPEKPWQIALRGKALTARLRLGACDLAVYEWGRGPTVLMVHGWGTRCWRIPSAWQWHCMRGATGACRCSARCW